MDWHLVRNWGDAAVRGGSPGFAEREWASSSREERERRELKFSTVLLRVEQWAWLYQE
jgi:hypothetical protein